MQRIPEPRQLMDDPAQAAAYAGANFSEANQLFIRLLRQIHPGGLRGDGVDLGCGPADIPIALLREYPELRLDAVDGAPAMLEQARARLTRHPELAQRLRLRQLTLPDPDLPEARYRLVLSNSLLHHLEDPDDLWLSLRHCAADGARVLVMDLLRPRNRMAADSLVETYALNEPEVLREDFRNSLLAAYTLDEVREQLQRHALHELELSQVSDRHWAVRGSCHTRR
jgi:trans-aconitate methyltransferase